MRRFKSGFTLVELLVVITIIGMLVGLLIPAVSMVRERGRQATCLANQKQIGLAILEYETSKNKLPGVMNQMGASGGTASVQAQFQYSWVEAILPNLEHADLWGYLSSGRNAAIAGIRVSTTICPDDPLMVDVTSTKAQMLLSYGVTDQFFVDYRGKPYNPVLSPPIGRSALTTSPTGSLISVSPPVLSNLKTQPYGGYPRGQTTTTTQTIMLGERTFADTTSYSKSRATQWGDPGMTTPPSAPAWSIWPATQFWQALTFPYPTLPASPVASPPPSPPISPLFLGSTHGATAGRPGTVIVVTYFDGHGAILPSDTPFPQ